MHNKLQKFNGATNPEEAEEALLERNLPSQFLECGTWF